MDFDSSLVLVDGFVIFTRAEVSVSLKRDRETSSSRSRVRVGGHRSGVGGTNGTEEDVPLPFAFLPRRV